MNLETTTLPVFARWTVFVVALGVAAIVLGIQYSTSGLWVLTLGFAHLYLFRPVLTPRVTDAELWRLIDG